MIIRKSIIFLLSILLLSGCWDSTELQDLSIITAAAIDIVDEGKIRISVQLFIPRSITTGQTGEDPSAGSTFVREGIGDSLADAVALLQNNIPRHLFWDQCKIFIIGQDVANKGIRKELDFLVRHPAPRGTSFLYISEGEAKDILTLVPPLERYSGEALRKLSMKEVGLDTTLMDVDVQIKGESQSTALPVIKPLISPEKSRGKNETIPTIIGTAIFKNDKMVGKLNMEDTRGLMWLLRKTEKSTVSIKYGENNEEIVMTPTMGRAKFTPLIVKNNWIMKIQYRIEGDLVQNETNLNLLNENIIKKLEKEFEQAVKDRLSQTMEKLQNELKADPIDLGRRFHQKYPKEWNEVKDKWDDKLSEVDVQITVNAVIRQPGDIGPPASSLIEG